MSMNSVLITGASRGIGKQIAKRFATCDGDSKFSRLILLSRKSETFSETIEELKSVARPGIEIIPYYIDLSSREEIVSLVHTVYSELGNVDIIINNAGYTNPISFQEIEYDDFVYTLKVDLLAPFSLVQEFIKMGNKFRYVINIASTAGIKGRAGWLTYSASKSAIITMSDVMRQELAVMGTRVICLSPGRCATDLRRRLAPEEDLTTIMQPEHVSEVILMLLSDVGKYIDSQNIVIRK